jgi:single-stranded DNA-binding protein
MTAGTAPPEENTADPAGHEGDPLSSEGRLEYRTFQDQEGKERGVAEVLASDGQFLGTPLGGQRRGWRIPSRGHRIVAEGAASLSHGEATS